MKKALLFLTVLVVLLMGASHASACACEIPSVDESFDTSDAVFTGRVTKARKSKWTIAVNRVWKGEVKETILLKDSHAGSSCSSKYAANESYLFFVRSEVKGKRKIYFTRPCQWSTKLKSIQEDLGEKGKFWIEDLILKGRGEGQPPSK